MVTIDIKNVQQTILKKIIFVHAKSCLSKKNVYESWILYKKGVFSHLYILGKNHNKIFLSRSTLIDTMPIWGNTDASGQNGRGKVNRSRPTHYDIGMSLHYA